MLNAYYVNIQLSSYDDQHFQKFTSEWLSLVIVNLLTEYYKVHKVTINNKIIASNETHFLKKVLIKVYIFFGILQAKSQTNLLQLLNEKDITGCSPLHYASREGHVRSLENLIRLGACINLKNNNNESPLHFAAR